ncbi:MAG: hypothetical protein AAB393_13225 [Bacteroidota bacterium]
MFRFLLYLVFGYLIWKIIQIVARRISSSRREHEGIFGNRPPQQPSQTFKDVQDAEFEELPPDDKKK